MKPKTDLETETFNDGVCSIFDTDEQGDHVVKYPCIRFQNRTVVSKRFFEAAVAQVEINAVIRIPQKRDVSRSDIAVIGNEAYKIEQVQHLDMTNPAVTDLTLRQIELLLEVPV